MFPEYLFWWIDWSCHLHSFSGKYYRYLPYLLIGSLAIFGGLFCFLLPESFGRVLPETMDQMQTINGWVKDYQYVGGLDNIIILYIIFGWGVDNLEDLDDVGQRCQTISHKRPHWEWESHQGPEIYIYTQKIYSILPVTVFLARLAFENACCLQTMSQTFSIQFFRKSPSVNGLPDLAISSAMMKLAFTASSLE